MSLPSVLRANAGAIALMLIGACIGLLGAAFSSRATIAVGVTCGILGTALALWSVLTTKGVVGSVPIFFWDSIWFTDHNERIPQMDGSRLFAYVKLVSHLDMPVTIASYQIEINSDGAAQGDANFDSSLVKIKDTVYRHGVTTRIYDYGFTATDRILPIGRDPLHIGIERSGCVEFELTELQRKDHPWFVDGTLKVTDALGRAHKIKFTRAPVLIWHIESSGLGV